ncbi:MAG: GTP-binding protein [Thermoplasmata archaeon]
MNAAIGLEALDRALDGGLRRPSSLLLYSEVLAEKRTFAEHFVVTGLRSGETCLYLDMYRSPHLARREFAKFGDIPHDRLVVAGLTAPSDGTSDEAFRAGGVPETREILERVEGLLEERRPRRVIFDSLDLLAEQLPPPAFEDFLRELTGMTTASGAVVGLLFVEWSYDPGGVPEVLAQSDYLIEFRSTLRDGALVHKLRLRHGGDEGGTTRWIPFAFREGRGLVLHFPRVLVAGPPGSGKSSFVQALSHTDEAEDQGVRPAAFDYGHVERPGVEVELLGLPGHTRFAFLVPVLARGTHGLLLVVDSTKPEELERAGELRRLVAKDVPTVVVANKRDLKDPMTREAIREALDLTNGTPVMDVVALEGKGVAEALEQLIDLMIWGRPLPSDRPLRKPNRGRQHGAERE